MSHAKDLHDTALWTKPRHPDLDAAWQEFSGLVWWWAHKLARIWNGKLHLYRGRKFQHQFARFTAGDFVGWLTVRLNYCLWFRDDRPLGTLFQLHLVYEALRNCLRYESESLSYGHWSRLKDAEDAHVESINREFHESDYVMYRVPERDTWAEEMVDILGEGDAVKAWDKVTQGLPQRSKDVLEMRYKHGKSLSECAGQFGVSKQRVSQIELTTLKSLRHRLERLEPVRRLFYGD